MIELTIFFLLLVKHAIVDLGLQSQLLWGRAHEKNNYFGGHQHYLHHAIGTFLVFVWFTDLHTTLLLTVFDYVAHWHIDFIKHRVNNYFGLTRKDIAWWWTTVVDQIFHFLTYFLLMLYVIS
jgi:hypothetical protein